jgi:hypothetical protein
MRAKAILVLATATAALLSGIYAGNEALARGGGGGRGGHGGMTSGSHGSGTHGMRHVPRFASKGQHQNGMHDMHGHAMGDHGKSAGKQGVWQKASQRNNNIQGQWQVGGGGGSVGDICINSGMCQGVWQAMPQSEDRTSRNLQRSWHVGDEM